MISTLQNLVKMTTITHTKDLSKKSTARPKMYRICTGHTIGQADQTIQEITIPEMRWGPIVEFVKTITTKTGMIAKVANSATATTGIGVPSRVDLITGADPIIITQTKATTMVLKEVVGLAFMTIMTAMVPVTGVP